MTAKIISLSEYKCKLNYESRVIRDIDTDEVICELPSPIMEMDIAPDRILVKCEDGKEYQVHPDGSYGEVNE